MRRCQADEKRHPPAIGPYRIVVLSGDDACDGWAVSGYARTALVFATDKEREPAMLRPRFEAANLLQAVAVGASRIVGQGLPEVVTVVERGAGNELSSAVDGVDEDVLVQRVRSKSNFAE